MNISSFARDIPAISIRTNIMACPTQQHVMYANRILTIGIQLFATGKLNNL